MSESTASTRTRRLCELATVVRSKNAGPTQFTIDIFFADAEGLAHAAQSPALQVPAVAALYDVPPAALQRYVLADLLAIKFSMPRAIVAGSPGDGDVYGAQQHAPLLQVELT